MRSFLSGLTRIRILNLREIRTHRLRILTSLSVVIVSSALLIAVLGTYGSMTESVRAFNAAITGAAQIEVAAIADSGLDDGLAGQLRAGLPDAKSVVPMVRTAVMVDGKPVPLIGSDYRVTSLSSGLRDAVNSTSDTGDNTTGNNDAGLTREDLTDGVIAGAATGLTAGQQVTINNIPVRVLRVVDDADGGALNNGRFLFAYLDLAQRLSSQEGKLDSILIVAKPGADLDALRAETARLVDGRAVVVNPDFRAKQAEVSTSVTRDATLLVSLISLVIAGFLVFNTMNMAVASRRQSLAMLRALGARRGYLVGDLLGEAAIFGLVGGLIGIPLGIVAGRWAIGRIPEASQDTFAIDYHLPGYAPVVAVIACVIACVAATSLAARSVFAVSPVEAMAPGEVADGRSRRGAVVIVAAIVGIILMIAAYLVATRIPDRPAIAAGAIYAVGILLFCFALTGPLVWIVVRVARLFGGPGQLAAVNTDRAPRRAWATLMTVAVAISVGMGTSGALSNLVDSISDSLDGLGDPDFYVSSQPNGQVPTAPLLAPTIADDAARVPGVASVVPGQWASVNVGEARILLQGLTDRSMAPFTKKASSEALREMLAGNGILLSNVLARTIGVQTGDTLRLATPTGFHDAKILDTVDYVAIDSGAAAISLPVLEDWFDRHGATYLQITLDPGADPAQVRSELTAIVERTPLRGGRTGDVHSGAEALKSAQALAEQSGAFTVAIQWIVAGAAAIALLNTLLLSVIERRRELGVLRAMGASRRFISRMVLAEAAAVAIVGSVVGVIIGGVLHWLSDKILTATTSVQVEFAMQWNTLIFVVVACGLCLVGALVPAVRAARMNISESILTE